MTKKYTSQMCGIAYADKYLARNEEPRFKVIDNAQDSFRYTLPPSRLRTIPTAALTFLQKFDRLLTLVDKSTEIGSGEIAGI